MSYITETEYEEYTKADLPADFAILSEAASAIIDTLTMNRIVLEGFDEFEDADQTAIKKAVCAEVHCLVENGGVYAITGNADGATSVSIGKFSESGASSMRNIEGIPVSPMINIYLGLTGLLNKGVGVWQNQYRNGSCFIP